MTHATVRLLARGAILGIMLAGATIGLLVVIPFTYQAVIRAGLVSGLPLAMKRLPWFLLLATGGNLALTFPLGRRATHWIRFILLSLCAMGSVLLIMFNGLSHLEPGPSAQALTLTFLAAAGLLLVLDLVEAQTTWPQREKDADDAKRLVLASVCASLGGATLFFIMGLGRAMAASSAPPVSESITTMLWSILAHGLVLSLAAVGVLGIQSLAGLMKWFPRAEFLLTLMAMTGWLAAILHIIVFPSIAFTGPFAQAVGVLLGFCMAAFAALLGRHLYADGRPAGSHLELFLRPLHPVSLSVPNLILALLVTLGIGLLFGLKVSLYDWNYLFQQLGAVLVIALIFAPIYLRVSTVRGVRSWSPGLFATPLVLLFVFRMWGTPLARPTQGWAPRPSIKALEAHSGFDASARLMGSLLRPSNQAGSSIYRVLLANSNIPHAVDVKAKDLSLVERLEPTRMDRPDIYVFVVDSLRQDYLGAYNKQVTFTPNLDRFAEESTVMAKAFTRYGATGLSEPSIWVGGQILHKQFIVPFHPLNTLQKLLETDSYRPFISMDSILDIVVKPSPDIVRLDAGLGTSDLRLGRTLKELQTKLDETSTDRPVFAYTQSQDLHISTIGREGKDVPGGGDYEGFYAPYASRVRRLDSEFGAFVQYLKDRGRFDRSIIIFTADHGDSLGEEGRFGHAYTLFPEIMKVPLILHVPEKWKTGLQVDPQQVAFNTDITPTLYYLLGHRPLANHPVLGRPLFAATKEEQNQHRRDHFLIASSYGAVWGILTGDGNTLYIADGVNFTDHLFDLRSGINGKRINLTPELKQNYDALILKELDLLNTFYDFTPGKGSP